VTRSGHKVYFRCHVPLDAQRTAWEGELNSETGVFWYVAPCSLVEVYQRFSGACCLHRPDDGAKTQKTVTFMFAAVRSKTNSSAKLSCTMKDLGNQSRKPPNIMYGNYVCLNTTVYPKGNVNFSLHLTPTPLGHKGERW
jgi:hypothetical protein